MIKSWDNAIFCTDTSWFLVSTFLWIFAVSFFVYANKGFSLELILQSFKKKKKKENLTYKSGHMEDVKTIQDIEEWYSILFYHPKKLLYQLYHTILQYTLHPKTLLFYFFTKISFFFNLSLLFLSHYHFFSAKRWNKIYIYIYIYF